MSPRPRPFKQFVHLDDNPPETIAYEVHLDPPYIPEGAEDDPSKWVGHYIGSAERDRLMHRIFVEHGTEKGARVLQVQRERGGTWHLVRTWAGGIEKEHQLKQQSGTRYCPEAQCSGSRAYPADTEPRASGYRSRKDRREAKATREAAEAWREFVEADPVAAEPVRDAREVGYDGARELLGSNTRRMSEADFEALAPRIEELEARWAREAQRVPQMELEASLHERGSRGRTGLATSGAGYPGGESANARAGSR